MGDQGGSAGKEKIEKIIRGKGLNTLITDEMLKAAAEKSSEIFVSYTESDYTPDQDYFPTHEFDRKIKKLYFRANHPYLYRSLHSVASIILAAFIAGTVWLTVNVEARAVFSGWIREVYGTVFAYRYSGEAGTGAESPHFRLTWIPEGYHEVFSDAADDGGSAVYENDAGQYLKFVYITGPDKSSLFVANKDIIICETAVNGHPADYLKSTNLEISPAILWATEDDYLFYISGYLSEDELIKISESIQEK